MAAIDDNVLDPDTEYGLLNGSDRAGLLLSSLGMNITQLVFQNMKDNDVKRMINAMSNVKRAPIWMVSS
jgi:flagellar motor switch protein FliG